MKKGVRYNNMLDIRDWDEDEDEDGRYKGDAKRPGIETDMIYLGTTLEFSK